MRQDIQLLRGLAVLLVVLFHANLGFVTYGYLGVDVFFVISGFLITSTILKNLETNNFSFAGFYLRRAKRLLPALYSTLAITAFLSYWFITGSQQSDFIAQLLGSLTFSSNLVLPTQVGYFESDAEGKPLLHIWSLSLEEQYYFFLPVLLFFTPKSKQLLVLVTLVLISATWCFIWASNTDAVPPFLWRFSDTSIAEWAFYLFPTRAWELLAGSICAWLMIHKPIDIPAPAKIISLLIILLINCVSLDSIHPRGDALIIVIATSLILLGNSNWLPKWRVAQYMEKMGDWSYSVYLVHWPIFAFSYLGYAGQVPLTTKVLLVFVSFLAGYAQYRFVETPFRYGWRNKSARPWAWLTLSTLAVVAIPAPMVLGSNESDVEKYVEIRKTNYGLSAKCGSGIFESGIRPECVTGDDPTVAIWGDSYAMHLVPGLVKSNKKIIQLTKSVCGPLIGLSPINEKYRRDWAEKCSRFNQAAFQAIVDIDSVTHVILSSPFDQYFKGTDGQYLIEGNVVPKDHSKAIAAMILTIENLKAAGKTPVLFSPPPRSGFNIGDCLERIDTGLISFRDGCDVLFSEHLEYGKEIWSALKLVELKTGVQVIWLDEMLCEKGKCKSKINGTYVYRDGGHLSISGSEVLLGKIVIK